MKSLYIQYIRIGQMINQQYKQKYTSPKPLKIHMNHKIHNTQSPKPTQPRRLDNQQHPHNYINFPLFLQ